MYETRTVRKAISALGLTCLVLALFSCSGQQDLPKVQKPAAEIRQQGATTVVTDMETGAQLVFGATDVPEGFPPDLPVFPEVRLRSHYTAMSTIFATFHSAENIDELKAFFLEGSRLQQLGWEVDEARQASGLLVLDDEIPSFAREAGAEAAHVGVQVVVA